MRKFLPALFIVVSPLFCFAQELRPFRLTDTTFIIGSVFTAHIHIELDNRNFRPESKPLVDSIADFMLRHPELIIEIGSHTDQRGSDSFNLDLSQRRATFVKNFFVSKGVDAYIIPAVGYGESKPLVTQAVIDKAADMNAKEDLYQRNRRYEFKILHVYNPAEFSFNDTIFKAGSVMRLPLLYDLGKPTLRPESYPLVDSLAKFLIAHPQIKIDVGNHTDVRGSTTYNVKVTQARSKNVVDRLIMQGVPAAQVAATGYGESQLLITEAYTNAIKSREGKEQLHQVNRRTEIKILSVQ